MLARELDAKTAPAVKAWAAGVGVVLAERVGQGYRAARRWEKWCGNER